MRIYKSNGTYRFMNNLNEVDKLDPGYYYIGEDKMGLYLAESTSVQIPNKIYGSLRKDAQRYVESFNRSKRNLGILLNGEKGSGKTLLANLICEMLGIPVIRMDQAYGGTEFMDFINGIDQPVVILIDEYDKLYSSFTADEEKGEYHQTELLKIMDSGLDTAKKLFILTSNKETLSEYMVNRPSRVRYKQSFTHLTDDEMHEVLDDVLSNKDYKGQILDIAHLCYGFNLDTLLTFINEINETGLEPKEAFKYMNIEPQEASFEICVELENGKRYELAYPVRFNPIKDEYLPEMYFYTDASDTAATGNKECVWKDYGTRTSEFSIIAGPKNLVYTHKRLKHKYYFVQKTREVAPFKL